MFSDILSEPTTTTLSTTSPEFRTTWGTVWRSANDTTSVTAYSDAVGHLFQSMSDSVPTLSDSNRSEATLGGSHKVGSGRRQGIALGLVRLRSPSEGRRLGPPAQGVVAPSLRAGGERRERTPELQFAFPPVATRHGLTRPPAEARLWCSSFRLHFPQGVFCLCAGTRP